MRGDQFETSDIYLAAALVASGHRPTHLDSRDRKTVFAFLLSSELNSLIGSYYESRLNVDALGYAEAIRSAKAAAMNVAGRGGR